MNHIIIVYISMKVFSQPNFYFNIFSGSNPFIFSYNSIQLMLFRKLKKSFLIIF